MRGEYQDLWVCTSVTEGSPPLARGIPAVIIHNVSSPRITPACAGNTCCSKLFTRVIRDHPRLRGEYSENLTASLLSRGSPPLARGIPYSGVIRRELNGITPACAGNTEYPAHQHRNGKDHPRLRGEYNDKFFIDPIRKGSPPLARGIRRRTPKKRADDGITPACAGNTRRKRFPL